MIIDANSPAAVAPPNIGVATSETTYRKDSKSNLLISSSSLMTLTQICPSDSSPLNL